MAEINLGSYKLFKCMQTALIYLIIRRQDSLQSFSAQEIKFHDEKFGVGKKLQQLMADTFLHQITT